MPCSGQQGSYTVPTEEENIERMLCDVCAMLDESQMRKVLTAKPYENLFIWYMKHLSEDCNGGRQDRAVAEIDRLGHMINIVLKNGRAIAEIVLKDKS